jgi:hypothetical protein
MKISLKFTEAVSARRAELLAELFLQDLRPSALEKTSEASDFDYLVSIRSQQTTNLFAVEVRAWQDQPRKTYTMKYSRFRRLALLSTPCMLLIADTQNSDLYYSWVTTLSVTHDKIDKKRIPVVRITPSTRNEIFSVVRRSDFTDSFRGVVRS